jgi:signal transduction histidine kinase
MSKASPSLVKEYSFSPSTIKPFRVAGSVAGLYLVLGSIYIYVSSRFAASTVVTAEQLEYIELYKGFLFILVTAILLLFTLSVLLQRLHRKEQEIEKQRDAIAAAGKQALAGLFAASIAHDLNNILSVSNFAIEMLTNSKDMSHSDKEQVERLRKVNNQIIDYTHRLADVSGKHLLSGLQKVNVAAVVVAAIQLAENHKKVKRCSIEVDAPAIDDVKIDEALLHRALLNVIINAAEATEGRGRILVKLSEDDATIRLSVHDDGPGILQEARARVLEPFYSTKPDGTGLGLLSVRHCAEVHQGSFGIEVSPLGGTCVYMVFPKK